MSRYYFDVHDGSMQFDEVGAECATLEDARLVALRLLPDIARDETLTQCGDRCAYAVLVSDEDHHPLYTATLSLTGIWLLR